VVGANFIIQRRYKKNYTLFFKNSVLSEKKETGVKCFVVVTRGTQTNPIPYLLRNYPTPHLYDSVSTLDNFVIPADGDELPDMTYWAAACATSAAPVYFSEFIYEKQKIGQKPIKYSFVDGGLVANCPLEFALQEVFAINPDIDIDYVLSLGTGAPAMVIQPTSRTILQWANLSVDLLTATQKIYKNCLRWLGAACKGIKKKRTRTHSGYQMEPYHR